MYNLTDNVRVKKNMCLKGQCHEIFDFRCATGVVDTGGKTEAKKSRDTVPFIP